MWNSVKIEIDIFICVTNRLSRIQWSICFVWKPNSTVLSVERDETDPRVFSYHLPVNPPYEWDCTDVVFPTNTDLNFSFRFFSCASRSSCCCEKQSIVSSFIVMVIDLFGLCSYCYHIWTLIIFKCIKCIHIVIVWSTVVPHVAPLVFVVDFFSLLFNGCCCSSDGNFNVISDVKHQFKIIRIAVTDSEWWRWLIYHPNERKQSNNNNNNNINISQGSWPVHYNQSNEVLR